MDNPEQTDEELAICVQQGDTERFGILMSRYERKLFRYGQKFISGTENIEDVVQDIFIKTYRNIQSFDSSQKFSSWIYRIAHNAYVDVLKKNSRLPIYTFDFDTLISHTVVEDPIVREREQKEMKKIVDTGLQEIPTYYREILVLYYLEEMSYKEISDILHVPIGTVGIRIKRAKEVLKKTYQKLDIHYGE